MPPGCHASPATRDEIDTLVRQRGITGGPGWLDTLALRLQNLSCHDRPPSC
jgi:hypothetical protein